MSPKVADTFTLFCYAFQAPEDFHITLGNSCKWKRSIVQPDKSYLFNHIQDFFCKNHSLQENIDYNQALIYDLRGANLGKMEKKELFLYSNFFNRPHSVSYEDDAIPFQFIRGESVLSPKLYFVPLTRVGIITFGIKSPDKELTLDQLLHLNYRLRVFHYGQIMINTPIKKHPGNRGNEEKIQLHLEDLSPIYQQTADFHSWQINTLINYFLSEFKTVEFQEFSSSRLQAFTFLALAESIKEEDLKMALFRLRRVYSNKYLADPNYLNNNQETSQTFQDIHYGASSEGAVVLINQSDLPFLKDYRNTVTQRTIWTYILCYHQRIALIAAAKETNDLFSQDQSPVTQELSQLIDRISKVELKCMFSEISHFTHQNDFYYLCYQNLRIPQLFREVKSELEEMNHILSEQWRKDEELRHKTEEKVFKVRARKLEMLIALLIIPQIGLALLSTNIIQWEDWMNQHTELVSATSLLVFILLVLLAVFMLRSGKSHDLNT